MAENGARKRKNAKGNKGQTSKGTQSAVSIAQRQWLGQRAEHCHLAGPPDGIQWWTPDVEDGGFSSVAISSDLCIPGADQLALL